MQRDSRRPFLSIGGPNWEWAQIYIEPRDWWVGLYISDVALYVCPLPCIVIKIWRVDRGD